MSSHLSGLYIEFGVWIRCCHLNTQFLLWTVFNVSVTSLKTHNKVVIVSSVMRKCSCHSWLLQGHILIIQADWEILMKWFPGPLLPEKMQIYQNKKLFFSFWRPFVCQNILFPIQKEEKILLSQNFWPSWVFWVIQMCRRNIANWLFLAAWETIATMGNDPASLSFEWLGNTNCQEPIPIRLAEPCNCCRVGSIPPAASSMASLAVRRRKQWDNSYSGRKLSSLTPASSRQQGYYLLLCWVHLPIIPLVGTEGVTFLQKWDCSRGVYSPVHCCKLWRSCCSVNSSTAARWKEESIQI